MKLRNCYGDSLIYLPQNGSLASVRDDIKHNPALTATQKRDWLSAIQRVSDILETPVEGLPATPHLLSRRLEQIHPLKYRISTKTWRNIKSNLMAAIRFTGSNRPRQKGLRLTPAWQSLYQLIPDERMKYGLSRLVQYCSHKNIYPTAVTDDVIQDFISKLKDDTLMSGKQRRDCHRRSPRLWNEAATRLTEWPQNHLAVPDYRAPRTTRPLTDFPQSFQADVDAYLNFLGNADPFSDNSRLKPLSKNTVRLRRSQLQLAASALVSQDMAVNDITSLASLVEVESIKDILRFYLDKKGRQTSFIQNLGVALVSVAKDWVKVNAGALSELKKIRAQLGPLQGGMTEKNRNTLRQFDNKENQRLLLCLPARLVELASKQSGRKAAVTYQIAITIELLINAPIRMGNLVSLRFDEHLVRPGGPSSPYHLVLLPHETKNGQPMEFCLNQDLSTMLSHYRTVHLPKLSKATEGYLFPGETGGHKHPSTLAQQLKETIYRHTGLTVTPHQFRHLAGLFYLNAMPGQYEVVRQLLGHKHLKTTTQSYASLNTRQAQLLYDKVLGEKRQSMVPARPLKKKR